MLQEIEASRISRVATWLIPLALLLVPFLHSGAFSEPFALPKELFILLTALLIAGLGVASYIWSDDPAGPISPAFRIAVVFTFLTALAVIPAINRGLAIQGFLRILAGVLIFWGVFRFLRTPRDAARLFSAVLLAAAIVSLGSVLQILIPGAHITPGGFSILPPSKGGSTLGDAGLLSQFLILAIPIGFGAAALLRGWGRVLCGAGLGCVGAALIFAGRPEGWVVALISILLILITRIIQIGMTGGRFSDLAPDLGGHSLWAFLVGLAVISLVISGSRWSGVLPGGAPASPLNRVFLLSPITDASDPSVDRPAATSGTMEIIGRHPMGVGPENWRHAFLEVAWTDGNDSPFTLRHQLVHPGNNFLERAAETGIAGGLVFVALILLLLMQSGLAATGGVTGWSVVGFTAFNTLAALVLMSLLGAPFEEPAPSLIFWMTAGVAQLALIGSGESRTGMRLFTPRQREFVPRSLRRRWPGAALAAIWIVAAVTLGYVCIRRAEADRLIKEAQDAFNQGLYEVALQRLGQDAARSSPDPIARAYAGNAYRLLGFQKLAAHEFGETIARSPFYVAAYLGRALAYQGMGRYDLADDDLKSALEIWPENSQALLALARLNATRGRLDDALQGYLDLARLEPSLPEPWYRAGEIFMRRGKLDEAIEAFRVCGTRDPRYPQLSLQLGSAFFEKGLLKMALRYFQAAANVAPLDVRPRLELANTHHALGDFCAALNALRTARDLETDPARRNKIIDLFEEVEPKCRSDRS